MSWDELLSELSCLFFADTKLSSSPAADFMATSERIFHENVFP